MTIGIDSQNFESYVAVYDAIPEKWEEARPMLVEQLKNVSNAVNIRTIGWYLDEELLSGNQFIPGVTIKGNNPGVFRSILRKVIDFSPLSIGLNSEPHGIQVDANFTLIELYAAATNSATLTGEPIPNGIDTITYDSININITVATAYDRAFATIHYIQEL
jgi:hypothetical protein